MQTLHACHKIEHTKQKPLVIPVTSIDDKFTLIRHDPPPFSVNSLLPGSAHCAFPPWRYLPWTPPVSPSSPLPALSTHYVFTFTCTPPDWHLKVFRIAELFRFGEAYRLRSIPEKRGKWKERVGRTMSTLGRMVGQQPNDKKQRRLVVFNGGRTPPPPPWRWLNVNSIAKVYRPIHL